MALRGSGSGSFPRDTDLEICADPGVSKQTARKPTPLPKLQLAVLLYIQLAEPITTHVMIPFIVQLVKETGITGGDVTKVGYYTGLADSVFFFTEALTILQWGRLSDRIGRRSVLFTGLFGLALSVTCFGLSHTFWSIVASRAISGVLNGNAGVIKSTLGEITDETNVAQAFALSPLTWATGNTISPLIGGMLQHPYERFGGIFSSEFWRRNPYFLPCAVSVLAPLSAFLLGFYLLRETRPAHAWFRQGPSCKKIKGEFMDPDTPSVATERSPLIFTSGSSPPPPRLRTLLTPRVLVVILNYALLGITEKSFYVLQPLVLSTPIRHGGLGMPISLIGTCIAAFGLGKGIVSALFFAPLTRRFGTKRMATVCVSAFVGCYALYPVMNALARIEGRVTPVVWVIFMVQLTLATLPAMGYSCIFIYLTSAAPTRSALGATNGLAQTTASITRTLGPAGVTSLFALSIRHNLLGGHFVYVVMCFFAVTAAVATLLLPVKPWKRADD